MNRYCKPALIACVVVLLSSPSQADMQGELDGMFNSMTNVTNPVAHMGQRRGVLSGGSVVNRNRIMTEQLVTLVPPSFNAGCGGIDLFAGSFSFVNAQQFVQLLRSTASNAAGYAFEVALGNMCKECLQTITTLQKAVQKLNQGFASSCRLAKGVVNDTFDAIGVKHRDQSSLLAANKGAGDIFDVFTATSGTDPGTKAETSAPAEVQQQIKGNLVWRALEHKGVNGWFQFGDRKLLEAIMSVTGSIVVGDRVPAADGKGKSNAITEIPPGLLSAKDLINGTGMGPGVSQQVSVYVCDTSGADGCLSPTRSTVTLTGLTRRIRNVLLGGSNGTGGTPSVGLISKFRLGQSDLTAAEKGFLEVAPIGLGGAISSLARRDSSVAGVFAERAAPMIAVQMVDDLIRDVMRAVYDATSVSDHAYVTKLRDVLDRAAKLVESDRAALSRKYGNVEQLLAFYNGYITASKGDRYVRRTDLRTPASPIK